MENSWHTLAEKAGREIAALQSAPTTLVATDEWTAIILAAIEKSHAIQTPPEWRAIAVDAAKEWQRRNRIYASSSKPLWRIILEAIGKTHPV